MIDGKRPEKVLIKNDLQTVSCPGCGNTFQVSSEVRQTNCPICGTRVNWGLPK